MSHLRAPRLRQAALIAIGALFLHGCGNEDAPRTTTTQSNSEPAGRTDLVLRTGTSFGECLGYCYRELTISNGTAEFVERAWDGSRPDLTVTEALRREEWMRLQELADPARLETVPDVLGCPDCADGGAEWVEIETRTKTERVMFEFGTSVEALDELLPLLRELRNRYDAVHPDQ